MLMLAFGVKDAMEIQVFLSSINEVINSSVRSEWALWVANQKIYQSDHLAVHNGEGAIKVSQNRNRNETHVLI